MLHLIEFAAVAASALYGVLRGLRKDFDVVGLASVAFAVAFGGGTLRDLLLDRRPLFWVANEHYVWTVLALSLAGAVLPRRVYRVEPLLPLPDAVGLGLFSIVGCAYAVEEGMTPLVASLFGVLTGAFGGVIGDVICNETPSLFRSSPLYATCAWVGAWGYLLVGMAGGADWLAQSVGIAVTVLTRLAALRYDIRIPSPQPGEESG